MVPRSWRHSPSSHAVPKREAGKVLGAPNRPRRPSWRALAVGQQRGRASWFPAPKGTCAHRVIPKGTVVTVVRVDNGASTTCRVADRGPADTSRVIDLSRDTFAKLAGAERGVLQVFVRW